MLIYKYGSKEKLLDYRPVSLTSIVCKICEKVIKKQWTEYLEREGIITDNLDSEQEGRVSPSSYSRVIDIMQEKDGLANCKYLNVKKPFDKVLHKRLLWKLE